MQPVQPRQQLGPQPRVQPPMPVQPPMHGCMNHMSQQMPQQMLQPGIQPQMSMPQQMQPGGQSFLSSGMQGAMGSFGFNDSVAGLVANQAMSQMARELEQSGLKGWFPNVFSSLQQLFNVGHSWVLRKLLLLLCPFVRRSQGSPSGPVWSPDTGGASGRMNTGNDGLKVDIEEADLYIPSMAYVTYILVYGVQRGMISDFRPEVLSSTASFALVLLVLEVGGAKMGFYVAGSPMPILQITANLGYKYVSVALMVIFRILVGGNPVYYVFFTYLSACAAYATRRFLLRFEPSQLGQQYGQAPSKLHQHIILGLAIAQIPLCWLLTPSTRGSGTTSISAM